MSEASPAGRRPLLIGDGLEDPHNVAALAEAAALFGWGCALRDRARLSATWPLDALGPLPERTTAEALATPERALVALDNGPGARPIYGFRAGSRAPLGLIVGNERRGIAGDLLSAAEARVEIPMASRRVNTLNVAAAAAVGMYYLSRGGGGELHTRADPERSRPAVLFLGAGQPAELGSALRSAAAFGWRRAFVEDRAGVWFGVERGARSVGRAAARRGKNEIRLVAARSDRRYACDQAWIVSRAPGGTPLPRAHLAGGPRQLVVVADEDQVDLAREDLARFAPSVRRATLELPDAAAGRPCRYRFVATLVLAEIARQVGRRTPRGGRRGGPPRYERALCPLQEEAVHTLSLAELAAF